MGTNYCALLCIMLSFIHSRKFLRWVLTSGSSWRVDLLGRTWRDRSVCTCGSRPGRTAASRRRTTGRTSSNTRIWWASSSSTRSGSSGWDTGSVEVSFLFILLLTPLKQGLVLYGRHDPMNHFRLLLKIQHERKKYFEVTGFNCWKFEGLNYNIGWGKWSYQGMYQWLDTIIYYEMNWCDPTREMQYFFIYGKSSPCFKDISCPHIVLWSEFNNTWLQNKNMTCTWLWCQVIWDNIIRKVAWQR